MDWVWEWGGVNPQNLIQANFLNNTIYHSSVKGTRFLGAKTDFLGWSRESMK